ncbi:NAD-dependent protein deacylase sirtuin-5 [Blattella germanica]|nr:NAD-dependent protein deacylase sirtuin-5 [Blattella germanica]
MIILQRICFKANILKKQLTIMAKKSQPSSDMAAFREVLSKSKHIAVLSGAGISAESGIPTFRGAGGYWRQYQAQDLASPRAFARDPSLVWEFYHYRREVVLTKQPNQAHVAVAKYEKYMRENGKKLSLITQNIDGLHQTAGSENVIELHGSLFKTRCTKCEEVVVNKDSPICPALAGKGAPDPDAKDARIPESELPKCHCGGMLRPHVVWFGESLDTDIIQETEDILDNCDLCLVIGTSSVVYPAAMFAPQVAERGVPVAEFNLEKTPATFNFQFHFEGPCGSTLPEALAI